MPVHWAWFIYQSKSITIILGHSVDIDINYCPLIIFQTLLVTGGWTGYPNYDYLSSTELLVGTASAWVYTGELPSPRSLLRGANIDNKVVMTGN